MGFHTAAINYRYPRFIWQYLRIYIKIVFHNFSSITPKRYSLTFAWISEGSPHLGSPRVHLYGLMVQNKRENQIEISRLFPRLRTIRYGRYQASSGAFKEGFKNGKNTHINKGMTSHGSGVSGLLVSWSWDCCLMKSLACWVWENRFR